jgi:YegS/Rv2252/BmrU family lipid kinase
LSRRPILLLVNPVAGGKPGSGPGLHDDSERLQPDALQAALAKRGLEVRLHALTADDDPASLARAAADDGRDLVVAGGDGTVSGVAAALVGHPDARLGILAMGSFNNIARGLRIPVTLDEALDVIGAGNASQVDAGWVVREGDEGRPFFEAAGVGVDAVGFLAVEIAGRRGWRRAARALLRGLRLRRTPMRITLDDVAYRTGSPAVTVSNGPYHGAGFVVSADADPADGILDVAVFHGMSRVDVIRHFLAVARRKARREPRIGQYRAKRVEIVGLRRALPAHADGESIGVTPVVFEVRPKALRVFR